MHKIEYETEKTINVLAILKIILLHNLTATNRFAAKKQH